MSARALMILGTASHVGKSILTAALCRIFTDEGYRVAPFKAQNMSLNSAATPDGREIGRAQALQAEACKIAASADMNPVLIKPSSDTSAQVVVLGKVWGQISASDYHQRRATELFPVVTDAYQRLAADRDIIVIEGAGSPAEINLKANDIVNMRMAKAAGARCILVGDIDRGGVFASLLGTVELLDPEERALLCGFVINKFRGDIDLLRPGIAMIEERLQLPCLGVVPWLPDLGLDEEDSVALEGRTQPRTTWTRDNSGSRRPLRIGVFAFPFLSNFTDFDALAAEPSVALAYIDSPSDVKTADLLILPGSKQTLDDLAWLRTSGLAAEIQAFDRAGGIVGICGGMQMLGHSLEDPERTESCCRHAEGLGLLPISTVLETDKVTCRVTGKAISGLLPAFSGYEIHLGQTSYHEDAIPFAMIRREGDTECVADGAIAQQVIGTYVHGLFQDDAFRHAFLDSARQASGLEPADNKVFFTAERGQRIDALASHVRKSVNMELIRACLGVTA